MGFVRSLHFYRKVPQDVTEATLAGGVMSLLALLAMGVLAVQHVSHFARVELETKVEVDEFADQPLRIEFNLTMHALPCAHVSLDVRDSLGESVDNITAGVRMIRRDTVTGERATYRHEMASVRPPKKTPPRRLVADLLGHDKNRTELLAENLTAETFDELVDTAPWVFVRFYADWCQHSRETETDWALATAAVRRSGRTDVAITQFSCTANLNAARFCLQQRVQAFPTYLVVFKAQDGARSTLEYVGSREFPGLMQFISDFGGKARGNPPQSFPKAGTATKPTTTGAQDDAEPRWKLAVMGQPTGPEACELSGVILVSRVPGKIYITPESDTRSYNPAAANLSHTVHTFRFSMPLPGDTHAYELTHLRYMLHPVVESAAEASFLVGDQFRDRLLTLAELASSDTERASPLEPGPEQVLGSGMQGDANMKKFVDAALGTFPESHNMSEPAAQKEARELVYGQMRANRVANLRERLGALPKDSPRRDDILAELRRVSAAEAAEAREPRESAAPSRHLLQGQGGVPLRAERALNAAAGVAAGASAQEKEPPRPVLGSAERWHHINSQWMDMIPDTSQDYWRNLRSRLQRLTEVPAENIAAQDKHEVERRFTLLQALFARKKQLLSLYDALGGDEFLTRYRRSSVEHHLKVIPMSWLPLGHDDPLLLYGYTTATREAQRNSFPAAIFAFEVSPVSVAYEETKESFADFVTQLCAVVGGVFTIMGMLDAVLHASLRKLKKL